MRDVALASRRLRPRVSPTPLFINLIRRFSAYGVPGPGPRILASYLARRVTPLNKGPESSRKSRGPARGPSKGHSVLHKGPDRRVSN